MIGSRAEVCHRRELLEAACGMFLLSAALPGCHPARETPASQPGDTEAAQPLRIRRRPVRLTIYPVEKSPISVEQFRSVLVAGRPPVHLTRIPLSIVCHALRLWGLDASFDDLTFERSELNGRWAECMFEILTDDHQFRTLSHFDLEHLLERSEYGVLVRTALDTGWGQLWGSPHVGAYLQVMAECRVASDTPVRVKSGEVLSLRDVVRDEARRVHPAIESEWVAGGLARYLATTSWRNRFDQPMSFDELALGLVRRELGVGACFGCHVPYALASLHVVNRKYLLLSQSTARLVRNRLAEYSALLEQSQSDDGSWHKEWTGSASLSKTRSTWGTAELDTLSTTGHHLEWMMCTEPELRPRNAVLTRAIRCLATMIPIIAEAVEEDWHVYLPISHAARAVVLSRGEEFAKIPD